MALPAIGTASYNGYTFPSNTETVAISVKPVYDVAGRTVTHSIYTVQLSFHVTDGATQGTTLETLRNSLERPGGEFVYQGRGFGELEINTTGKRKDLVWGPKPQLIQWKPTGGAYSAKVVWQCEVALISCTSSIFSGAIMELNYKVSINIDQGGWTSRTVSGYYKIPQTRTAVGNRVVGDTADNYWDRVVPPVPAGFQRKSNSRSLDESKCRMDFSFTDEQLPITLPDGITAASGSHQLQSQSAGLTSWVGTITANYECAAGQSRSIGWKHFVDLIVDRVNAERSKLDKGVRNTVIVAGLTMTEPNLYGKECCSFTFNYKFASGKEFFIPLGGLWRPVPGDFSRWSTSLADAASPRGQNKMKFTGGEDAIVDLCLGQGQRIDAGIPGAALQARAARIGETEGQAQRLYQNLEQRLNIPRFPNASDTWLMYENKMIVEQVDYVVEHKPLPTQAVVNQPQIPAPGFMFQPLQSPPVIAQMRASPSYYVRMVGKAVRLGFKIPPPVLQQVGGCTVVQANHPNNGTFWSEWLAGFTTGPIFAAEWNMRYLVVQNNGGQVLKSPKNEAIGLLLGVAQ